MSGPAVPVADLAAVTQLLGRVPAGRFTVVVRRIDGTPAVIENDPLLDDGRPMPTRYWLVDRALRESVSRLEASGGVRRATAEVRPAAVAEAHVRYASGRDALLPPGHEGASPSGGVGGTRRGVKCLHAHLAWYLAGGDDPVGRWTAEQLGVKTTEFSSHGGTVSHGPVAAVDCGTNATRLLVVAEDGTVLKRLMRITRLGEGVDAGHRLRPGAVERTLSTLRDYRRIMDDAGVVRARVVATSAVRDAVNGDEFLRDVATVTGVRPELLSGNEEGLLSYKGATAHLPAGRASEGSVLVVDIGGGSTEFAVGPAPRRGRSVTEPLKLVTTHSLDIGCVRVTERFLLHDPPRLDEVATARSCVSAQVVAARDALPVVPPNPLLVGLAGTVSTLASLSGGLTEYDRARVHHAVLERAVIERWARVLASEDAATRLRRPGMVPGREDVIVGGVLILAVVMEVFECQRCLVSEDDILDGLTQKLLVPTEHAE